MSGGPAAAATRLVVFEVAGGLYALPIADVLEVSEVDETAAIPSVPRRVATVMNHHGDALPLVAREALFGAAPEAPAANVLVLASAGGGTARLGLPVDRVVGLADLALGSARGSGLVVERRPLRGRIANVLDARRLEELAARAVEEAGRPGGRPELREQGETS